MKIGSMTIEGVRFEDIDLPKDEYDSFLNALDRVVNTARSAKGHMLRQTTEYAPPVAPTAPETPPPGPDNHP